MESGGGLRGANVYIKHCERGCAKMGVRTWGCNTVNANAEKRN